MDRDIVIALAREADIDWHKHWDEEENRLERFAALVAAHEREECANVALTGTGEAVQLKTLELIRAERERIADAIRSRT